MDKIIFSKNSRIMPLTTLVEAYLTCHCGNQNTWRAKRVDFEHFMSYLASDSRKSLLDLAHLTSASIRGFLQSRMDCGEAPSTVNRRLATIKHFCACLSSDWRDFSDPAKSVSPCTIDNDHLGKTFTNGERDKIIDASRMIGSRGVIRERNHIIVMMLIGTGLRAQEILDIKAKQISKSFSSLAQVRCKGDRYRNVMMTNALSDALQLYMPIRDEFLQKRIEELECQDLGEYPILISPKSGKRLGPDAFKLNYKSLWRIIDLVGKIAEIPELHPHLFRHDFAHRAMHASNNDLPFVQQLMGHASIQTTCRYALAISEEKLNMIRKL